MATNDNNNKHAATDPGKEELNTDIETNSASNDDATMVTDNPFKAQADDDIEANRQELKRAMEPLESRTANPDTDDQLNTASTKSSANENKKGDDSFVNITNDAGEIE
ncbi:MAG: hypothetical protein ABIN67_19605 [Ferruginibacter sp.]